MGTRLLSIRTVRRNQVQEVVRQTLSHGLNMRTLDDFLAKVDWSGAQSSRPAIADVIGQLELWSTEYGEGDLTDTEMTSRLRSLLPADERQSISA